MYQGKYLALGSFCISSSVFFALPVHRQNLRNATRQSFDFLNILLDRAYVLTLVLKWLLVIESLLIVIYNERFAMIRRSGPIRGNVSGDFP